MNGLSEILWNDATVDRIDQDFEAVRIKITDSNGVKCEIVCAGYIGISVVGFWDEAIVRSARIVRSHAFIDDSIDAIAKRLGASWVDSGSPSRNTRDWSLLEITLIDELKILVVAADFSFRRLSS